jgi:sugar phosphate isomerase/epimerase
VTMRLGIAQGPLPTDPRLITRQLAQSMAALGIEAVTTHFGIPNDNQPHEILRRVRETLGTEGIAVVQAAGYNPNLVASSASVRSAELRRLEAGFRTAGALGAEMLLTGCGSLHPDFFYGPALANHLPETRERLIASLRESARFAEECGIPLALECHVLTCLDTPEHVVEVLTAVDSPWVRVNFDPVNFIGDLDSAFHTGSLIRHAMDVLMPFLAGSAHVKDVVVEPALILHIAEAAPGTGLLDFDAFFDACRALGDRATMIIEHLDLNSTEQAVNWLKAETETFKLVRFGNPSATGT